MVGTIAGDGVVPNARLRRTEEGLSDQYDSSHQQYLSIYNSYLCSSNYYYNSSLLTYFKICRISITLKWIQIGATTVKHLLH